MIDVYSITDELCAEATVVSCSLHDQVMAKPALSSTSHVRFIRQTWIAIRDALLDPLKSSRVPSVVLLTQGHFQQLNPRIKYVVLGLQGSEEGGETAKRPPASAGGCVSSAQNDPVDCARPAIF